MSCLILPCLVPRLSRRGIKDEIAVIVAFTVQLTRVRVRVTIGVRVLVLDKVRVRVRAGVRVLVRVKVRR